jgi:hypothetical protein
MNRNKLSLLAGAALLVGCTSEPITTEAGHVAAATANTQGLGPAIEKDLATLRQVTAPFQQFDVAQAAQWSAKITSCMTDPGGAGGMGFHYGNLNLINGSVSVDKPQLLLYEPQKNGRLRLVAVEYIIPYTFHARDAEAPRLFNQPFKQNDTFQLWGLHAWVWKNNPSGIFADWNPDVNCDNTTDVAAMAH